MEPAARLVTCHVSSAIPAIRRQCPSIPSSVRAMTSIFVIGLGARSSVQRIQPSQYRGVVRRGREPDLGVSGHYTCHPFAASAWDSRLVPGLIRDRQPQRPSRSCCCPPSALMLVLLNFATGCTSVSITVTLKLRGYGRDTPASSDSNLMVNLFVHPVAVAGRVDDHQPDDAVIVVE